MDESLSDVIGGIGRWFGIVRDTLRDTTKDLDEANIIIRDLLTENDELTKENDSLKKEVDRLRQENSGQ